MSSTNSLLGTRQPAVRCADQLFQEQATAFHDATMEIRPAVREARDLAYAVLMTDATDPTVVQALAKRWLDKYGHDRRDAEIPENCRAA